MDEPKDKQPDSNQKLSGRKGKNLAMKVPAGKKKGNSETKGKILEDEVGRFKELIAELKGNLIAVNKGIVARQDTIDQLTKQKQKLLGADKDEDQTTSAGCSTRDIRKTNARQDLGNNPLVRDAIEVFPEEIWELILGNLTEPQDLRNCSQSCQLFDKILHPFKPSFLFLEVFPHICSYLDNELILSCRRVCKGWNEGVDSFVENHPALVPCDKVGQNPSFPPLTKNGLFHLEFSNAPGDLRERNFLEKMRYHPRNPFVGRAVSIRVIAQDAVDDDDVQEGEPDEFAVDSDDDNREQDSSADEGDDYDDEDNLDTDSDDDKDVYGDGPLTIGVSPDFLPPNEAFGISVNGQKKLFWKALLNFLKTFGKHIWYLSFECNREGSFIINEGSVFRFLTERIFSFAQNLRTFAIEGFLPRPNSLLSGPVLVPPMLEALRIARDRRRFRFEDSPKASVSDTLIHASFHQLKELRVDWSNWKHIFKSKLEWPNLTELHITNDGQGGTIKDKYVVPAMMPYLRKLTLFHLDFDCYANKPYVDFQQIMGIINGLSKTTNLNVFRLFGEIPRKQILRAPIQHFAHPSLKTLEVTHPSCGGDYTLLLRFPLIESLVILHYEKDRSKRRKARFERQIVAMEPYMTQGRIYECEIWELLPRLKNFMVQRYTHTRKGKYGRITSTFTREGYERTISRKNDLETEVK